MLQSDARVDEKINWLSCATRDATALALFADTFGGDTALLTSQATVIAVRERFEQLASSDPDDWNSANEKDAAQLGVKQVVLPARGRLSPSRAARQKQRWFRRGQRWRAGIEARVSTLKHCFGIQRALYKGESS